MKRVWSGATLADTAHLKNLLELAGIGSYIKNAYLAAAIGELPVYDSGPELWVFRDDDASAAETLLSDAMRAQDAARPGDAVRSEPWRCGACGESNESQFAVCWSCGASDGST
jgi:hypothetical protein